jgi:hypothetical protein
MLESKIEVQVIRGYKLKLWKERLNLAPDFVNQIDITAKNFVHMELPDEEDSVSVILFTKTRHNKLPIPVRLRMTTDEAKALIERIEI